MTECKNSDSVCCGLARRYLAACTQGPWQSEEVPCANRAHGKTLKMNSN